MSKFNFNITKRAIMNANVVITADNETEAREKFDSLNTGIGEDCLDPSDGQMAEDLGDLKWEFECLDDSDSVEIVTIRRIKP